MSVLREGREQSKRDPRKAQHWKIPLTLPTSRSSTGEGWKAGEGTGKLVKPFHSFPKEHLRSSFHPPRSKIGSHWYGWIDFDPTDLDGMLIVSLQKGGCQSLVCGLCVTQRYVVYVSQSVVCGLCGLGGSLAKEWIVSPKRDIAGLGSRGRVEPNEHAVCDPIY